MAKLTNKIPGLPQYVHNAILSLNAKQDYKDIDAMLKRQEADMKILTDYAASLPDGNIVGSMVRFHIADGYAVYVVASAKPLALLHLNGYCDGYAIPEAHMRGLKVADIQQKVRQEQAMSRLFGRR